MYLFSADGRRHFLEYLRNLTPQVLLLSTAMIEYWLWKQNHAVVYALLCTGTGLIALLAVWANLENFLDNGFSSSADIAAERDRLKGEEIHGVSRIRGILGYIWRERRRTVFELAVVLFIIYGAVLSILMTALVTMLRTVR